MNHQRLHILVSGVVQGVFFRDNTVKQAHHLRLKGWVRNLMDGRVEILAEGPRTELEELLEWATHGPPQANVTDIQTEWLEAQGNLEAFALVSTSAQSLDDPANG